MEDKFDAIRFFYPEEVNPALRYITRHPLMKFLLQFSFPNQSMDQTIAGLSDICSIEDFQSRVIYPCMKNILKSTSAGLSFSGLENLNPDTPYLFISNHRDIVLDTGFLNMVLLENGFPLTASVIGNNLVKREIYLYLAKLNRNFFVKRDASPRELLLNSQLLSEYICHLETQEKRSIWIAQREGRAKDGNDFTQPGVLKMIAMNACNSDPIRYLQNLNIVPISISYEYDPTDKLKTQKAVALEKKKQKNEDVINILTGVTGQKKHINIHFGQIPTEAYDEIAGSQDSKGRKLQHLAAVITHQIIQGYRLWPSNYIAADMLERNLRFAKYYTEEQAQFFIKRMSLSLKECSEPQRDYFLRMYANPVFNKEKSAKDFL